MNGHGILLARLDISMAVESDRKRRISTRSRYDAVHALTSMVGSLIPLQMQTTCLPSIQSSTLTRFRLTWRLSTQRRIQRLGNELEVKTEKRQWSSMARRKRETSTSGGRDTRLARIDMTTSQMGLIAKSNLERERQRGCGAAEKKP